MDVLWIARCSSSDRSIARAIAYDRPHLRQFHPAQLSPVAYNRPHLRQLHPAQLSHVSGTTVSSRNSGGFRTQTPSSGGFRTLRGLQVSNCRSRSQLVSESRPAAPVVSEPRPAARRATTSRQKARNRTRFYRAAAKSPAPRGNRASHASGASDRNRTRNPLITNQLLYR